MTTTTLQRSASSQSPGNRGPADRTRPNSAAGAKRRRTRSEGEFEIVATLCLAALTAATAVSMSRVFDGWAYLRPMVATGLLVHVACWIMRRLRVPVWLAIPIGLVLVIELVALFYYRSTTTFGLATSSTVDLMAAEARLIWQQFPTAVAPVPGVGSFAAGGAVVLGICALLADTFAFRAYGRAEATVPTGVVFIFTSALSTDRNRVSVAALWLAVAIGTVAVLRICHSRDEVAWLGRRRRNVRTLLPGLVAIAAIVGIGAATIAPRLPGAGEKALIDTRNRGDQVTQVVSPLVDIRSRLVNRGNVELFSVTSEQASYWKLSSLMNFDGTTWTQGDDQLLEADNALLSSPLSSNVFNQSFVIKRLGGNLVPAAPTLVSTSTGGLLYSPLSQTLVVNDRLSNGTEIGVTSNMVSPTPDQLNSTGNGAAPPGSLTLPDGIPDEARTLAVQITAGATTPYQQAIILQNWFKTEFEYDLKVQKGHSDDAIRNFLSIRRGYCEQFAGTFAVMARAIGLPARVAVGFTAGDLGPDGQYRVYGRNAHAWAEVWFDGFGWVLFDPTPGRGAPGAENHTGWPAAQEGPREINNTGNQQTPQTSAPRTTLADGQQTPTTARRTTASSVVAAPSGSASSPGSGSSAAPIVLLAIIALVIGWLTVMPMVTRWWQRRRQGDAADRIADAWNGMCRTVRRSGVALPTGATPYEVAQQVQAHGKVDYRLFREASKLVTLATYGPAGPTEAAATRMEELDRDLAKSCLAEQSAVARLRAKADPREVKLA
jgi:transglutaminase-like putative cysteine protease